MSVIPIVPAPHLAALAQWMRLAQTEVYEVASFYHHFEVVKEDAHGRIAAAPALTVRVCDGLSCETAPVAVVHQVPVLRATAGSVHSTVTQGHRLPAPTAHIGPGAARGAGLRLRRRALHPRWLARHFRGAGRELRHRRRSEVARIARVVHFLDAGGIRVAEAAGLEAVLAGLRELHADDATLPAAATAVFDALCATPPAKP